MKPSLTILFLAAILAIFSPPSQGQDGGKYTGHIFDEKIHTVSVYREGWPLSLPYLNLSGNEKLVVTFDDLSGNNRNLSYTLIHCDAHWHPSGLFPEEYLEGFPENPVNQFRYATNTTVPYLHYTLHIPDDALQPTLSGNYLLMVYENSDTSQLVFTTRFVVYENLVAVTPHITKGWDDTGKADNQQVTFEVTTRAFPVQDPDRTVTAVVLQNGNMDGARYLGSPDAISNQQFSYLTPSDIVFPGSNEFRHFEITDIRFVSKNVETIQYKAPYYNVLLLPSGFRRFKPYLQEEDINGKFYIRNARGTDPAIDADYLNVLFTLPAPFPVEGSRVYVWGGLTGWHTGEKYAMPYNLEQHQYELSLLLKQGHYDYLYVTKKSDGSTDLTRLEGNHFETDNDYTIILYYRPIGKSYDRIIGLRTFTAHKTNQ